MFKDICVEGKEVRLVPYDLKDIEDLYEAYSDPKVMELNMDGTTSKQWVIELVKWMIAHCYENNMPDKIEKFGVSIEHKDSGKIIGWCGLGSLDCTPAEIEIFYGLNSQYWGRGYGFEAAELMLGYGFDVIGLSRIVAAIEAKNTASRRIIQKLGMGFEKILEVADPNLAGFNGLELYAISKEDYSSRSGD